MKERLVSTYAFSTNSLTPTFPTTTNTIEISGGKWFACKAQQNPAIQPPNPTPFCVSSHETSLLCPHTQVQTWHNDKSSLSNHQSCTPLLPVGEWKQAEGLLIYYHVIYTSSKSPLTQAVWKKLLEWYGGGPMVAISLYHCPHCQKHFFVIIAFIMVTFDDDSSLHG